MAPTIYSSACSGIPFAAAAAAAAECIAFIPAAGLAAAAAAVQQGLPCSSPLTSM